MFNNRRFFQASAAAAVASALLGYGCKQAADTPVEEKKEEVASVLVIEPVDDVLVVGSTLQLQAIPRNTDGETVAGYIISWGSTDDDVLLVSGTGSATALSPGTATVTATAEKASGTAGPLSAQKAITVVAEPLPQIVDVVVWPVDPLIPDGVVAQLYVAVLRADGSTECSPEQPSTDPNVLFNGTLVAGCDSATALLDLTLIGN